MSGRGGGTSNAAVPPGQIQSRTPTNMTSPRDTARVLDCEHVRTRHVLGLADAGRQYRLAARRRRWRIVSGCSSPRSRKRPTVRLEEPLTLLALSSHDGLHEELERALVVSGLERGDDLRELARLLQLADEALARARAGDAVEELGDRGRRERADELVDDTAVAKRLHRRDALHAVALRELLVGVDVDLRENDLAAARLGLALEDRPEPAARSAPLRPEVHDDRNLARAVEDLALERLRRDVHV